jgi:hypothetical protein
VTPRLIALIKGYRRCPSEPFPSRNIWLPDPVSFRPKKKVLTSVRTPITILSGVKIPLTAYSLESPVKKIMKHSTMNGDRTSGKKIMDVDTIAPPNLVKRNYAYHGSIFTAPIENPASM